MTALDFIICIAAVKLAILALTAHTISRCRLVAGSSENNKPTTK